MMDHVVTLIADPATAGLDDGTIHIARTALLDLGADAAPSDWLAPGIACDIRFRGLDRDQAQSAVFQAAPARWM